MPFLVLTNENAITLKVFKTSIFGKVSWEIALERPSKTNYARISFSIDLWGDASLQHCAGVEKFKNTRKNLEFRP